MYVKLANTLVDNQIIDALAPLVKTPTRSAFCTSMTHLGATQGPWLPSTCCAKARPLQCGLRMSAWLLLHHPYLLLMGTLARSTRGSSSDRPMPVNTAPHLHT